MNCASVAAREVRSVVERERPKHQVDQIEECVILYSRKKVAAEIEEMYLQALRGRRDCKKQI